MDVRWFVAAQARVALYSASLWTTGEADHSRMLNGHGPCLLSSSTSPHIHSVSYNFCLPICLFICMLVFIYLPVCLSVCLPVCYVSVLFTHVWLSMLLFHMQKVLGVKLSVIIRAWRAASEVLCCHSPILSCAAMFWWLHGLHNVSISHFLSCNPRQLTGGWG